MKSNLPKTSVILLGGQRYELRHLNETEAVLNNGLCSREDPLYIAINDELKGPLLLDTVIHEVLHAIMWERKIIHNLDNVVDIEEFIVTNMASGLVEVLRLNPQLLLWLNSGIKKCSQP